MRSGGSSPRCVSTPSRNLAAWLAHLRDERRLSPHTLAAYDRDTKLLLALADGRAPESLRMADIRRSRASFEIPANPSGANWIPMERLFGLDKTSPEYLESPASASVHFESWALVHRGLLGGGDFGDRMFAYLAAINRLVPVEDAGPDSFKMNFEQLDASMKEYASRRTFAVGGLRFTSAPPPPLPGGRVLGMGEALAMIARVSLDTGFSPEHVDEIIETADRLSRLFDQLESQQLLYTLRFSQVDKVLAQFQAGRAQQRLATARAAFAERWRALSDRLQALRSGLLAPVRTILSLPYSAHADLVALDLALAELAPGSDRASAHQPVFGAGPRPLPQQRPEVGRPRRRCQHADARVPVLPPVAVRARVRADAVDLVEAPDRGRVVEHPGCENDRPRALAVQVDAAVDRPRAGHLGRADRDPVSAQLLDPACPQRGRVALEVIP